MEFFLFLLEILVELLDAILIGADVVSWFKGRENRIERRIARKTGTEVPPRDKWNRRVIVLSIIVIILTTGLLVRYPG